ncbi:hypothetical protein Bca101_089923 [Brassica carinata]
MKLLFSLLPWSGDVAYIDDNAKKDLNRPYGRVNRKQLKSKMLQKCITNGVTFHQAKRLVACFGMDILLKLDLEATRRFFDAFFDLQTSYWHGFLSSRLLLPDLVFFGCSLFSHASNRSRFEIMTKGTVPLAKMINNLVQDID